MRQPYSPPRRSPPINVAPPVEVVDPEYNRPMPTYSARTVAGFRCGLWFITSVAFICSGCTLRERSESTSPLPSASGHARASLVLRDGFEDASLREFWLPGGDGTGRYEPGAVVLCGDFARSGRQSARITLWQGAVAQTGDSGQPNERAELDSGTHSVLEKDLWYGFSFLLPPGFPIVDTRLVLAQWKQSGLEGSPVIAQRYVGGRHYVTIRDLRTMGRWRATYELPEIVPGRWNDMVYHIRFAADDSGFVAIWMNGDPIARFDGPTAAPAGREQFYHKLGLYRDRMAEPMTIYIDNYAIGADFEAVDPARFAENG